MIEEIRQLEGTEYNGGGSGKEEAWEARSDFFSVQKDVLNYDKDFKL